VTTSSRRTGPRTGTRIGVVVASTLLAASTLSGCGVFGSPDLVIYNAQHEQLLDEIIPMFEEESGLDVELRNGKDLEMANQIVEEGEDSPADVFLTENSPAMSIVDNAGLFAELPEEATASIPEQYVPANRTWTGFLARSTVAMYNTESMTEADMPASILDFADPEWQGRVAFSPTGADFQAIVSAVLELEGEEATRTWLEGLKANGEIVQNNLVVMQSVDSGEVDAGIAYHYYWYRDREENGTDSDGSALHFFGNQDPGAFLSISGAGILASSEHRDAAEEFVTWLTGAEAQQAMAESYALEYPLNPDASLNTDVKPFDELDPPQVDIASLNGPQVTELMTAAGLL
jgi:iron(III) transport system substrate-binding protein